MQDPRVLDSMLPYLTESFGNPHSRTHSYGWEAESATEIAREVDISDHHLVYVCVCACVRARVCIHQFLSNNDHLYILGLWWVGSVGKSDLHPESTLTV